MTDHGIGTDHGVGDGIAPGEPFPLELSRARFRTLLAGNPNYFGTLKDSQLGELFKAVEEKQSDIRYEEIGCVSYSPELDRLEATIVVKQSFGYSGGPCTTGSVEHVRFFVDFGSGWVDAGVAATRVYDVATNRDCAGDLDHPYVHVVGVVLTPLRKFCASPVLPRGPRHPVVGARADRRGSRLHPRLGRGPGGSHPDPPPPPVLPGRHPRRDRAAGAARSGDDRRPHRHRPAADADPRAGPDRSGRPQPAAVATRSRPRPGAVLGGAPQPHLLARQVEGPRRPGARPGDRPTRPRGGATAPAGGERGVVGAVRGARTEHGRRAVDRAQRARHRLDLTGGRAQRGQGRHHLRGAGVPRARQLRRPARRHLSRQAADRILRAAVQRRLEGVRRLLGRLRRRLHVHLPGHGRGVGPRLHHDAGRRPVVCGDPAARRQRLPAAVHRAGAAPGARRAVVEHAAVHHRPRSRPALGQPHRHPRARAAGSTLRRHGAAEHRRWRRYRRDRRAHRRDPADRPHRLQRGDARRSRLPVRRTGDRARTERPGADRDDVSTARPQRHGGWFVASDPRRLLRLARGRARVLDHAGRRRVDVVADSGTPTSWARSGTSTRAATTCGRSSSK